MNRSTIINILRQQLQEIPEEYYDKYNEEELVGILNEIGSKFMGEKVIPYLSIKSLDSYFIIYKKPDEQTIVFPSTLGFIHGFNQYLLRGYDKTPILDELLGDIDKLLKLYKNDVNSKSFSVFKEQEEKIINKLNQFPLESNYEEAIRHPLSIDLLRLTVELGRFDFSYYDKSRENDYLRSIEESEEYDSLLRNYIEQNYAYFII